MKAELITDFKDITPDGGLKTISNRIAHGYPRFDFDVPPLQPRRNLGLPGGSAAKVFEARFR
jgi:hypothetical protein